MMSICFELEAKVRAAPSSEWEQHTVLVLEFAILGPRRDL